MTDAKSSKRTEKPFDWWPFDRLFQPDTALMHAGIAGMALVTAFALGVGHASGWPENLNPLVPIEVHVAAVLSMLLVAVGVILSQFRNEVEAP